MVGFRYLSAIDIDKGDVKHPVKYLLSLDNNPVEFQKDTNKTASLNVQTSPCHYKP